MKSANAEYRVDRVDAEGYEPGIIDGTQVGSTTRSSRGSLSPQTRCGPLAL